MLSQKRTWILPIVMLMAACTEPGGSISDAGPAPAAQLPRTVVPGHYRLDLVIVPDRDRFSGHVEIDIVIEAPVEHIWLHGKDLDVDSVRLQHATIGVVDGRYMQVTEDGVARTEFDREIPPGSATLVFDYSAAFGDSLNGLYKVTVGTDHYAFTQLESIYARQAFPSFDEPSFKTPFDISVTTRAEYRAIGNTAATSVILDEDMQRVIYATTEPLPTYLVAFAVGPLDVVEWEAIAPAADRREPLALRGIAARGQGPRMAYALRNTAPLLRALEQYFDIGYPYDKLDIVAVPDFSGGAMENAGLITYRESRILFDDEPPANQIRSFAGIHAHELAHQWFGNLVTMPWWDDVWLNEAFASWMQARIAQEWGPEYRFDLSTQKDAIGAMSEDSLISARQIREPVESAADIFNAFDPITYDKGAGVLQMFERYVGPDVFRDSIREHMKRHFMATATVYDFMETLSDVAGDDRGIKQAFKSFLFQPGVPYLQIQQVCSDDTAVLQIQQERFLPAGSAGDPGQSWAVPVCVAYGKNGVRSEECFLLAEDQQSVPLSGCPDWLMPNAGGAGYFRWRLEPEVMDRLFSVFLDELDTAERIAFVDSLVAGVNHGSIPLPVFFDALPVITAAAERSVLEAPINAYRYLLRAVGPGETADAIRDYARRFYLPRLEAFSSLAGSPLQAEDELLRYRLVSFLAIDLHASEVRGPLNEAVRSYLGYGTGEPPNPDSLSMSLLRPGLVVAAQEGDADFIEFLMARFNESDDARFRQYVMMALAFVTDAAVVDEVRRFVLGPDIRGNELQTWLYWSLNPEAPVSAWPWVQENIDKIIEQGSGMVARKAAFTFGQWLCKSDDAALLASLFEPFVDQYPGSRRNLDRALESIGLCDTYRQIHSPSLAEYF